MKAKSIEIITAICIIKKLCDVRLVVKADAKYPVIDKQINIKKNNFSSYTFVANTNLYAADPFYAKTY